MMTLLNTIKNWISQRWDAFAERLLHSRSEARIRAGLDESGAHICARLDELETRVCDGLDQIKMRINGNVAPVRRQASVEVSVPLGSISVPIGDGQRTVEFQGVELSQRFYGEGLKRITETLYGIGTGQYHVHIRTLTRGKGLRTEYVLREVGEDDLGKDGEYAALGQLRLPMTVEEALKA